MLGDIGVIMAKDIYNIYMTFPSDVKTIKENKKVIDCSVSRVQGLELRDEFGEILTTSETAIKYLLKKKIAYFNKKITPSFSEIKKVIPCGDSLDNTKQLGDNIIKLCEQIIEYKSELPSDSKIKLYIDTSGGFRNAAMLFLIVGRIMSYMGIEVANIYYTSWVEGVCTVHEIKDTYDLLDLIAGFEEFLMFGSEPIEKEYTSLFKQKSLDTMDELSYVEWCLKHDYIQQALTLFKECVPDFLIKKGVIVVDEAKFCNYIKNKKLKADMNILETALNKWNAMHPERHSNNLFKLDEFLNVYTDGVEPIEDVRDDADLVFNEINEYRTSFIAKYTNRDALFKKLSAIVKAYVVEAQNKEFRTNKAYIDIEERNKVLGEFLKSKQKEVLECIFNEIKDYIFYNCHYNECNGFEKH